MLIIRYFGLLFLYHLSTAHKQMPWQFICGLFAWPFMFFARLMENPAIHGEMVRTGIMSMKVNWEAGLWPAPAFIQRRFDKLDQDAQE